MMVGRSFTHSLTYSWVDTWDRLDGNSDGNTSSSWQAARFDSALGRLCATLSSSGDRLGLWDFSLRPVLVKQVPIPVVVGFSRCACLEWSSKNERIALILMARGKLATRVNFQQHCDLVVLDVTTGMVVAALRLPFAATCVSFLQSDIDLLLVSAADVGAYCLIDSKLKTLRVLEFNGMQSSDSHVKPTFFQ